MIVQLCAFGPSGGEGCDRYTSHGGASLGAWGGDVAHPHGRAASGSTHVEFRQCGHRDPQDVAPAEEAETKGKAKARVWLDVLGFALCCLPCSSLLFLVLRLVLRRARFAFLCVCC